MDTRVILLLFVAAAFNGIPSVEGSLVSWVISELGNLEQLNLSAIIVDSNSTQSELKDAVIFYLYTNSSQETPEVLSLDDDDALSSSSFDPSLPTRIIIHGWQSSYKKAIVTSIRDAYLAEGNFNIIAVDWSEYSGKTYVYARTKIVTVGSYVGQMVDFLESEGMIIDDLIVMGHSLGAHVAGIACRSATNTVANLIAFDPAGPLFHTTNVNDRLRSTDAAYVQVIHSNAGKLGYDGSLGDADFWPNGGSEQAGCILDIFGICAHRRSYLFFAESIASNSSKFIAQSCESYSLYSNGSCSSTNSSYIGGLTLHTAASGQYYLTTNKNSPYAQG